MSNIQKLLTTLQQDGVDEDEISFIFAEMTKGASVKLYTQAMIMFDEDKKIQVADAETEEEEGELMDLFYKYYTGKTPEESIKEYQEEFAKNFIEKYEQDKNKEE